MSYNSIYLTLEQTGTVHSPLLLSDVSSVIFGASGGFPKPGPVYVPTTGSIDILFTSDVALSYERGAIRAFINAGHLTATFVAGTDLLSSLNVKKGWIVVGDATTSVTPISVPSGTWTQLTCDGAGSTSNSAFAPSQVSSIWNPGTNALVFDDLSVGDVFSIRVNLNITPVQNDARLTFRYYFPAYGGFTLTSGMPRLSDGAGVAYPRVMTTSIFIGDGTVRQGGATIEVYCSSDAQIEVVDFFFLFDLLR